MTNTLPSGTVTLLFSDIEDSSQKWEAHRSEMAAALEVHNQIVLAAVASSGGVVVKDKGDGYIVAFHGADDAIACALGVQLSLRDADWPEAVGALRVRMALHSGTLRPDNGDYHGPVINRTARLEGIAHGGQVLVSDAARSLALGSLPEGASLVDLGIHTLRSMERPERLFQLMAVGLTEKFPPLRTSLGGGVGLPSYPMSFVGRDDEQKAIGGVILDGTSRLVTLLGPGGIGKTRLAVETARSLSDGFAGGTFFVDLARFSEPDDVGLAIAEAVGAHPEGTASHVSLAAARVTRPTLLVLDNFEHLHEAAGTVAELLELAPDVHIIATSRTPLRITSEWIFQVDPLASNSEGTDPPAAVLLFYERAAGYGVSLPKDESDARAVRALVRRLDGLPLAIELVAARTRLMSVGELEVMLSKSLDALGTGAADMPERHRTIRATIDWSLSGLTVGQRGLFARLSIFPAGATFAQLEFVAGPDVDGDLLDELTVLVDNSLVNVVTGQPGGTRYRQLVLLREYGAELLVESGDVDVVMGRLVDYYVAVAPEQGRRIQRSETAEWEIKADHSCLVAAMNWGLNNNRTGDLIAVLCDTWVYWFNGDRSASAAQWVGVADEQLDVPKLDWLVGFHAVQSGDYEKGVPRLMRAMERFEESGDAEWNALSQTFAGALTEDVETGRRLLKSALAQFGEDEFSVNAYVAKLFLSINYVAGGDVETALSMREELVAWSDTADYALLSGWGEWHVAAALIAVGRIDDAQEHSRRVLNQMVTDGYQEGSAAAVDLEAVIQFHRGERARAVQLIGGADAIFATVGAVRWPEHVHTVEPVRTAAREQLGAAQFERLLAEGRALSFTALTELAFGRD
ncbi:MAG: adenylate/guanylate cyclase domain-containing protein [Acidimicrobiia bacterium]